MEIYKPMVVLRKLPLTIETTFSYGKFFIMAIYNIQNLRLMFYLQMTIF